MKWQQEYIERLVAPLALREVARERLREELWGHLVALYEEELTTAVDSDAARQAACERLGDSGALECEFNRGLTWAERVEGRLFREISASRVSGLPITRWAAGAFVKSSFALLLLALACVRLPGMTTATALIAWTTGTMLLALAAASAGMTVLELRTVRGGLRPRPFSGRLAVWAVVILVTALTAWGAGYAASWIVCWHFDRWDLLPVVELFGREVLLRASVLAALLAPASAWTFAWQERRARQLPGWPYLDAGTS